MIFQNELHNSQMTTILCWPLISQTWLYALNVRLIGIDLHDKLYTISLAPLLAVGPQYSIVT